MKKLLIVVTVVAFTIGFQNVKANELKIGFVNFKTCLEQSKQGLHEKNAFEALKKQMTEILEKTNQELEEIAKNIENQDYMDGLSPTAEEELKQKFQRLNQEFSQYQNQYYQLLNQANYKMLQTIHEEVSIAAEHIRESNNLSLILNEESTFAYSKSLDYTEAVTAEMDKHFELQNSSQVTHLDQENPENG